ncbi:DEAD/DEAH box helicase [Thalassobacillus sp. CUG 92003]|uniref:DEAD/DEAH box helicase n=1 Tax=Thalassobacillus sp. CUG 92003 TaxID=2736641 RepID=UPI0015E7A42A|nr:SNF2-related protein [Thalassobacillus sp. CUG 92003]
MKIQFDEHYGEELEKHLQAADSLCNWSQFQLAYKGASHTIIPEFKGLAALKHLPALNLLPHQAEAAESVIHKMDGRAILADEVGLGKTIEAGLVLKEYLIRNMAAKVLILTPASLVNQWVSELHSKFHIQAIAPRKKPLWKEWDIVVTSMDMAKREPNQSEILSIHYDLIIIDEAHKLKNHKTKNYQFVRALQKKYCLLLTATPIQNKITDLFNLVSVLKPGYLGDLSSFKKTYREQDQKGFGQNHIHSLINNVMVRNRRKDTGLNDTKRLVKNITVSFSEAETEVYQKLHEIKTAFPAFTYLTLAKEMCSSREACYMSIQAMLAKSDDYQHLQPISEAIEQLPQHAKAEKMVEIIQASQEKFIVFTEYRATQFYLQWFLQQHGISSVPFSGKFKKGKRDWMKQLFEQKAQVMVATEAAGEGINLQFCRNMINYDLPWNPMRLEQRIGRIHRFGQDRDVNIFNFAIEGTIEEHILHLLYEKIRLFEGAIGNLDDILEKLPGGTFDQEITRIVNESASDGEAKIKLDNLSSYISYTQSQREEDNYEQQSSL